jgi:hypothetical protein
MVVNSFSSDFPPGHDNCEPATKDSTGLLRSSARSGEKQMPIVAVDLSKAPKISARQAGRAWETDEAVFVDVREMKEHAWAHIPGSISVPMQEMSRHIGELPKDKTIIFY